MANKLPPAPKATHELKQIYPWDEHSLQWLFAQLRRVGYAGDYDDFKQAYEDMVPLIEGYNGPYHVTPRLGLEQVLDTKNRMLGANIVIDPIPTDIIQTDLPSYAGNYNVTPMANVDQILRTRGTVMEDDVTIEQIPYYETTNDAGGYTVVIG